MRALSVHHVEEMIRSCDQVLFRKYGSNYMQPFTKLVCVLILLTLKVSKEVVAVVVVESPLRLK